MKPNEVRNLTIDEIEAEIGKRRELLLNLRFQAEVSQLNNNQQIRTVKREVARLLTIAAEKQQEA